LKESWKKREEKEEKEEKEEIGVFKASRRMKVIE
jgi:hypothetical protein